ncbi:MAG TPA: DUF4235 domain-containing protein [Solirubrobacteraceae bacterium]|nr:DUF4235 domain-containing protein [Solirubrobacteraceae bacterium]
MNALFKATGFVVGLLAGIVGRQAFNKLWGVVSDEEPPEPTTRNTTVPQLLFATAMQGAILAVVRAFVSRGLAHGWAGLTGMWPGEEHPDPD